MSGAKSDVSPTPVGSILGFGSLGLDGFSVACAANGAASIAASDVAARVRIIFMVRSGYEEFLGRSHCNKSSGLRHTSKNKARQLFVSVGSPDQRFAYTRLLPSRSNARMS